MQFFDKNTVDVPVVLQRQVFVLQKVQRIVEVPQRQHTERIVDVTVVLQYQVTTSQTAQKTVGHTSLIIAKSPLLQIHLAQQKLHLSYTSCLSGFFNNSIVGHAGQFDNKINLVGSEVLEGMKVDNFWLQEIASPSQCSTVQAVVSVTTSGTSL